MAIPVLLSDDSTLVREGVSLLLQTQPDLDRVAVCADEPSLLAAVEGGCQGRAVRDEPMDSQLAPA